MKLTVLKNKNEELQQQFVDEGYNEMLIKLLVNRGYSQELISQLLQTGYTEMPSLTGLTNLEIGADIIESHIANNSTIWIFGDYDSDGINSCYILGDAINNAIYYSGSKASINLKLPERHEGYGLNMKWCEDLVANNADQDILVITVDNGIAQRDEVNYLKSNNIDVLITDHHSPNGNTPNDTWIIDAHYNNDDENNKGLCGAGVAFKLAIALLKRYKGIDIDSLYYKYMAHVAIATITDSMPMTIDNIRFVYNGIQLLKDGYASDALTYYKDYNSNTDLTPKDIAFGLGPQINACGRMNNTQLAIQYLFSEEEEIEDIYNEIVTLNEERKTKTKKSIEIAEANIKKEDLCIVQQLKNVEGIAGIIASNLSSKYNRCTIIFSESSNKNYLIGSARNDGHLDLLSILKSMPKSIVVKVGGHSAACGITIKADKINEFKALLNEAIQEIILTIINNQTEETEETDIMVDDFITVNQIKPMCESLKQLYFFTQSTPVFAMHNVKITNAKPSNNNKDNVQFTIVDENGESFTFWSWGIGEQYRALKQPKECTLIGEVEYKFGKPSFNILNIIPKGMLELD